MRLVLLAAVVLALVGCAPAYPALVCAPGNAGELAFGYHVAGALFAEGAMATNGTDLLFVDGACHYWARPPLAHSNQIVEGVLDPETLAAMNEDLLTADWHAVDGLSGPVGIDADFVGLARDDLRAHGTADSRVAALVARARDWARVLGERGASATGPVRLEIAPQPDTVACPSALEWTGTPSLAAAAGTPYPAAAAIVVAPGELAETLRAARAEAGGMSGTLREGSGCFVYRVVDVVPFADADGCLRPLFPGDCRIVFNSSY